MGPLTVSEGFKYIFTIWIESIPLRTLAAEETLKAIGQIIARHSCPGTILTDQGTSFTSKLFAKVCKNLNIQHKVSSAYHHQTKGLWKIQYPL